jgi:hypothetical protein
MRLPRVVGRHLQSKVDTRSTVDNPQYSESADAAACFGSSKACGRVQGAVQVQVVVGVTVTAIGGLIVFGEQTCDHVTPDISNLHCDRHLPAPYSGLSRILLPFSTVDVPRYRFPLVL